MDKLNIGWMYPDMLNLHGDKGNLMALSRIARKLGWEAVIIRHDDPAQPVNLDSLDMLVFCAGELRAAHYVAKALQPQQEELRDFAASGRPIVAVCSSGAALAKHTHLTDGNGFAGLGLLDMECYQREQVYGDDLWFTLEGPEYDGAGMEIIGNQIQVMDTELAAGQAPLGRLIYGRGNNSDQVKSGGGPEGARSGSIIFTNCLGPLLVKNPLLAVELLQMAARAGGREIRAPLPEFDFEERSAGLIRSFIRKKM